MTEKNAQELLSNLELWQDTMSYDLRYNSLFEAVEYLLKKDVEIERINLLKSEQDMAKQVQELQKPATSQQEPKPQTIQIKTETPKVEQTQPASDTINNEEKPEKKYKLHYIIGRKDPVTKEIDVSDPNKTFDAYGNTTEEVLDFAQKYIDENFPDWGKNWGGNLPESILK